MKSAATVFGQPVCLAHWATRSQVGTRTPDFMLSLREMNPLSKVVHSIAIGPSSSIDRTLDYYLTDVWTQSGDPRTSRLPFMGAGPWKLLAATLVYLYLIKRLLPALMLNRKPLDLGWPIRAYNLMMVVCNAFALYHGVRILKFGVKCFGCETIDHQDRSPQAMELLHYGWLFFMSRIIEWLDTIFFVLRKRQRQVTKLHVFHHSFVPLFSWVYLKYHPGYTMAFFPLVNSLVHTLMYSYYFLATFGPRMTPYLWWKRHLTSLQIAQFVMILIQLCSITLIGNADCRYPRGFLLSAIAGASLFLWLFFRYYKETYRFVGRKIACCSSEGSSRALADVVENSLSPRSTTKLP